MEIEVLRTGDMSVPVTVNYASSNGTAIAGQDYTAVAGMLIFPPNASEEPFFVPILVDPARLTLSSFFNVTLSQPTGGASLGSISSATVTINNENVDVRTPLAVTGIRLLTNRHHIVTGLVVKFQQAAQPDDGRQLAQLQLQRNDSRP